MKRSPLRRKTPLERKPLAPRKTVPDRSSGVLRPSKPLGRGKPQAGRRRPLEPGELEWKRERVGVCAGCGARGKIVLHHVIREQDVRRLASPAQIAAGAAYDLRNAMGLGAPYAMGGNPDCTCHADHHHRGIRDKRLPLSLVPESARAFAVTLMGRERAWAYLEQHYR